MVEGIEPGLGEDAKAIVPVREFRPEPFSRTKSEWAADGNRQQIIRNVSVSTTATLFTVPIGQTLFITSAYVSLLDPATLDSGNSVGLEIGTQRNKLLVCTASSTINTTGNSGNVGNIANNFPMPIRVEQGDIVRVVGGGLSIEAGFQGYLE